MKRCSLRSLVFLPLVMAYLAGIAGCSDSSPQHTEIAEDDIVAIMNQVERATLAKDLDGVIQHLAPFVVIDITMGSSELPFLPRRVQMTRDRYAEELKKVFAKASRHEYRRENTEIALSDDRRSARTESDIVEVVVMDEREVRTTTHETIVLEIIDGRILVTSIDAVIVKKESE